MSFAAVDEADGAAERTCALAMVDRVRQQHQVRVAAPGADKGYDSGAVLVELERRAIAAHIAIRPDVIVASNEGRRARAAARARQHG